MVPPPPSSSATPRPTVTSRALALLGAFDADHPQLTLSTLARRAGLPLATAHRLVAELAGWGALARLDTGEYVVGRRIWDLGLLAPVQTGLREVADPYLHDLYGATGATVHLAVREGTEALYVARVAGRASVPVVSKVGSRLPLHATGVGKLLLAHAGPEVEEVALTRLDPVTPHTITRPAVLSDQLVRVRRDGYAVTVDEMSIGASSVAVPVRRGHEVVAALGVVVPALGRHRSRLVIALQVAAGGISRSLTRLPADGRLP